MSSQLVAPLTKGCSNETTSRKNSKSSAACKWTLDCLVGVETRSELEAGVAAVEESSLWPAFSAECMSLITLLYAYYVTFYVNMLNLSVSDCHNKNIILRNLGILS